MAEAVRRDLRERLTRVLDDDRRCALGRLLTHDCRRALLERLFDIFVAVGRVAADGDEQIALADRTRVVAHFTDLGFAVRRARKHGDAL